MKVRLQKTWNLIKIENSKPFIQNSTKPLNSLIKELRRNAKTFLPSRFLKNLRLVKLLSQ